ncbi:MAG: bi-domain-containing oxidoreductase [Hyphomicrobiaceae bacterium]
MKQILQNLGTGETVIGDVPCPLPGAGRLLIATSRTLVSAGTERMLVDFGKASMIDKARQQPDKVRMVLDKVRTDGLMPTIEAVQGKLDQPIALGYCNVGRVLEAGAGVSGFVAGDRVVSNGNHAEVVSVPVNLCAKVPDTVSDDAAAFTVLGAIALQGIRLVAPTLGESVVVTGLGLIGLMTVQLLRAHGARVFGIDLDPARLAMARRFGAETFDASNGADPVAAAEAFSRGRGVDAVIITVSNKSSEPMHQAASMCRQRGRIVLVGVTGLSLSRADFYEKELTFQVSCSYGPGRYDPNYEQKGQDYPVGFVRWTEQRNFEAVLDMMADGRLDVGPLVSHTFAIGDAQAAYAVLAGGAPSLGIMLTYPQAATDAEVVALRTPTVGLVKDWKAREGRPTVSFIGAGNYAGRVLAPAFKAAGAQLLTVVSAGGVTGVHNGRKFGFAQASTDTAAAIADRAAHGVVIATRHDTHARFVMEALAAGKDVFVEKPLCLTLAELAQVEAAMAAHPKLRVVVGFNRRFAPHIVKMKALLATVSEPKSFIMTVNAGEIPGDHWTQDRATGGGRIVGEACHFIDLLRYLAGAPIIESSAVALGLPGGHADNADKVSLTLKFGDGSVGTIHYLANGHKGVAKERLEVFGGGRVLQLDNFIKLKGWGFPGFSSMNFWRQDKGQRACVKAFVDGFGKASPVDVGVAELIEVSRVAIELQRAVD